MKELPIPAENLNEEESTQIKLVANEE